MLGRQTLGELFAGRSRLNVYLLPFDPGRDEGYVSYSSGMDHMDGMLPRWNARDVTFVGASPARPPRNSKRSANAWLEVSLGPVPPEQLKRLLPRAIRAGRQGYGRRDDYLQTFPPRHVRSKICPASASFSALPRARFFLPTSHIHTSAKSCRAAIPCST